MSIDQEPVVDSVVDPAPAPLDAYLARIRRQRRYYVIALVILVGLIFALIQIVLRTGEIAHASLHTAKSAVPAPPSGAPSPNPTLSWRSPDKTAAGVPYENGTVVTYDTHTVTGRNYASGAAVWSYTRTDVSICTVFQESGTTIAIFTDRDGYCDEVNTFATGTGARSWYRTLDSNGATMTGRAVFSISVNTLLITTPNYVQAVDPGGGIDRWTFVEPTGCTTTTAIQGSAGVLIGQHCGDGDHLVLRGAYDPDNDSDKNKPIRWRISSSAIPVSSEQLISAFDPKTSALVVYAAADGNVEATQTLTPTPNPTAALTTAAAGSYELISVDGTIYSVSNTNGTQLWSAAVNAPLSGDAGNPFAVSSAGIIEIDITTGKIATTYAATDLPAGSTVVRFGTGFVVAGSSTLVYH